ncbi:MAG TPA: hydrogen gas-evolving membrane-bound hydrogenase subunit E [Atribacteraceae bacterium]|nr:hydrogen gas-evolving membrane-bound hydrogenase subunit E [Atribacteraceae bacterium]
MPIETWLYVLLGFMIVGSIVALELTDLLSAVISVSMVGLGLSVAFLLLQAPDLALVQFVFEIIAGIFLIVLMRIIGVRWEKETESTAMSVLKAACLGLVMLATLPFFYHFTPFGQPLVTVASHYLSEGLRETGAVNLVTAIILDYRVYDTLGESVVIFVSILGVITLLRKVDKGDGRDNDK